MRNVISLLVWFLCVCTLPSFAQEEAYPFENEIKSFQQADKEAMPPKGSILFIGSSSIRLWDDLESRFHDLPIVKRGVGGCELADFVQHYMDKIVFPYDASKIVVYAGENDIANGKSSQSVIERFEQLWNQIREQQGDVPIYFLAIKPSNSRIQLMPAMEEANKGIRAFLKNKKNGTYIDVASVVLNAAGQPDDALFKEDRLHLNDKGYDLWEAIIRPYLE